MPRTEFIALGHYVPERVLTNDELKQWWDTSDEWIRERTGIVKRHWVEFGQQSGSDLAVEASHSTGPA
jgi:3-oxoacyl-[acyl-carrier-protein] synthase III